jgi:hypothetical protein
MMSVTLSDGNLPIGGLNETLSEIDALYPIPMDILLRRQWDPKDYRVYFKDQATDKFLLVSGDELIKDHSQEFSEPFKDFSPFVHIAPEHLTLAKHLYSSQFSQFRYRSKKAAIKVIKHIGNLLKEKKETKLGIEYVKENDLKEIIEKPVGAGLTALAHFKPKDLITTYGGLLTPKNLMQKTNAYAVNILESTTFKLDGKNIRSLGSIANDSFPNAVLKSVSFPYYEITYLEALTDILPGEPICLSYHRAKSDKNEIYINLRPNAVKKFVEENPLSTYLDKIPINENVSIYLDKLINCWAYILEENPVCFLQLILRKEIPLSDLNLFFRCIKESTQEPEKQFYHEENIDGPTFRNIANHFTKYISLEICETARSIAEVAPNTAYNFSKTLIHKEYLDIVHFDALYSQFLDQNNI